MSANLPPEGLLVVLGLGNPGPDYEGTRHNLGADTVRTAAGRFGLSLSKASLGSLWAKGAIAGRQVVAALPQTFMNRSGLAASQLLGYYKLGPECLVAVHDDLDLPLGRIKVSRGGGAGGHKGVASLMQALGTGDFARLKVGIGRPRYDEPVERYVLAGFYSDQNEEVVNTIEAAADCLVVMLTEGIDAAMQRFHRSKEEEEG